LENNTKYRKILLSTDFSENSLNACRYGMVLAKECPVELIIFHAAYSPALDLIKLTEGRNIRKKLIDEVSTGLFLETEIEMQNFKYKILSFDKSCKFR
jgi:hypothetical protein